MTFQRINPSTWSLGAQLRSSQLNQLDIDHANAADKTTANDTVAGVWTLGGGTGSMAFSGSSGGIQANIAGAIKANASAAISSTAVGGIELNGTANDWITYTQPHTKNVSVPCSRIVPLYGAENPLFPIGTVGTLAFTAQASGNINIVGAAFTTNAHGTNYPSYYFLPLLSGSHVYHGATLSLVTMRFFPNPTHGLTGSLPNMPGIGLFRSKFDYSVVNQSLYSQNYAQLSGVTSLAQYNSGGGSLFSTATGFTASFVPDQNNVIDTANYGYFAVLWDECGANSLAGGTFQFVGLTNSNITSSAPG
jgi:hypothetical protein